MRLQLMWVFVLGAAALTMGRQGLDGPECQPYWSRASAPPTTQFSFSNMVVHNDGTGDAIYAVRYTLTGSIFKFDGDSWAQVPTTGIDPPGQIYGPVLLHDGIAERLCVWVYSVRIGAQETDPNSWEDREWVTYRWTGKGWTRLVVHPAFEPITPRLSLPWHGTHMMMGYQYNASGDVIGICRWKDSAWTTIGTTLAASVYLYVFDDEAGPALLAFGDFTQVNGVPAQGFAKWDGQTWTAPWPERVLSGAQKGYVFDDGSGPALYGAFGAFVNGVLTPGWGRWDGHQFTSVGGVVNGPGTVGGAADMVIWDDGTGPAMYIAGGFNQVTGGVEAHGIAKYRNGVWSPCGAGIWGSVQRLFPMNHARGSSLFAYGGAILGAGGGSSPKLAQYVGCPNCYANCDMSATGSTVNANDFICFISKFVANDPYANCDVSIQAPAINAADFACFLQQYAAGCP